MKKKILTLLATVCLVIAATPISTLACTPRYQPVSSQSWYASYKNALKSAKTNVKVPQGALDAAARAGAEAGKNIKLEPK